MENNWWDKIAEDLQFAADMQFLGLSMQVWCCSLAQNHWLNSRPLLWQVCPAHWQEWLLNRVLNFRRGNCHNMPAAIQNWQGKNSTDHFWKGTKRWWVTHRHLQEWHKGMAPVPGNLEDSKDASIVHVYKRKGDRASCYNHRSSPPEHRRKDLNENHPQPAHQLCSWECPWIPIWFPCRQRYLWRLWQIMESLSVQGSVSLSSRPFSTIIYWVIEWKYG